METYVRKNPTYTFILFWKFFLPTWLIEPTCLFHFGNFSYLHVISNCKLIREVRVYIFQNSKYTVGIQLNVKTTLMISKEENGLILKNNQNPRVRIPEAPNLIKITVILRANFQMTLETDTNGLIGDLELILIETLDGETTIEIGQINKMVLLFRDLSERG